MKKITSIVLSIILIISTFLTPFDVFALDASFGYDVSHNNQIVDCSEAKENGKAFVMIRLGYSTNHPDKNFFENVKNAYENQMPFGVYFYSYAYNETEAKEDADFVIETLSQLGEYAEYFTLPVAYDLEDSTLSKLGRTQITKQATIFCDTILKAGYVPMVYANTYWYENLLDTALLKSKEYKLWYAYYPDGEIDFSSRIKIGSTGIYPDMWQYKKGEAPKNILDENIAYDMLELSHNHIWKLSKTEKASLSKDGKLTYKCSVCNKEKSSVISKINSIKLSATSYVYSGKERKPTVTVKDSKGNTLPKSNYTVTYSKNKNVGKACVKVAFKGNYSASKALYFTINPKGTAVSKLTPAKKAITVKWNKQAVQTTGYQLQYSTDSKFKSGKTLTVAKNSQISKKISSLKAKKKYYIRIRTYKALDGKKYYSSWSAAKSVKTK